MSENKLNFQISEISDGGLIIGRNCGNAIPKGTVFINLVKQIFSKSIDGEYEMDSKSLESDINIKLLDIQWCHRQVNEVPKGHTAGLIVSKDSVSRLQKYFAQLGESEYLSIEA